MRYERSYFHDAETHAGKCPADELLEVEDAFSREVKRWAVKLATLMPYEQAEEVISDLTNVGFSDSAIWRCVQEVGQKADNHLMQQAQQRTALPDPDQISRGIACTAAPLGASMDGVKFNVRGEGWKEAKVACIFNFAASGMWRDRVGGELVEIVKASNISYVFHLGPPESFGRLVWANADQRGWLAARQTVVLGDGAPWIWNLAAFHFDSATHIVDWYHAKQHLWDAAHLIYGTDSPKAAAFVERHESNLYTGHLDRIDRAIRRAVRPATRQLLLREAAYFTDNAKHMTYSQFQQAKLPIGSGTVESGCKQFKDRFAGAGMRWSRQGAIHLMPLRAATMSKQFDQLWQVTCH